MVYKLMTYKIVEGILSNNGSNIYKLLGRDGKEYIKSEVDVRGLYLKGCIDTARVYDSDGVVVLNTHSGLKRVWEDKDKFMSYNVIKRITYNRIVVGYQLMGSDGNIYNTDRVSMLDIVSRGFVCNVKYNKNQMALEGNGIDLRKLGSIDIRDLKDGKKKERRIMKECSNHKLYDKYMSKVDLVGDQIECRKLSNDRVRLVGVKKGVGGRLVIPNFVTEVQDGVFIGSSYEEVVINNKGNRVFNARKLFMGMTSERLKVVFKHPENITNMSSMFIECSNLKELDIRGLDTKNVEDMSGMFNGCSKLKYVDVSSFNTGKVKDMSYMFGGCNRLEVIDVTRFDTSRVEDMSYMFAGCKRLEAIDVSSFNTGKVKDMSYLFANCADIEELSVSNWDVSKVEDISGMFLGCTHLSVLDLSKWNIKYIKKMDKVFKGCESIERLDISKWDTRGVGNMEGVFSGCKRLKEVRIGDINTSRVDSMKDMCRGCTLLEEIDISKFSDISLRDISNMFSGCEMLKRIDVSWIKNKNIGWEGVFDDCNMLKVVNVNKYNCRYMSEYITRLKLKHNVMLNIV